MLEIFIMIFFRLVTFADLIILITKYINVFTLLEKEQVFISYSDIHFFCIHICLEF